MRFSKNGLFLAGLAGSALAEDLLFMTVFQGYEYTDATTILGFTAKVVSDAEWRAMTTADFAKFKAIVIADYYGDTDLADIKFLEDTKTVWSPAVTGNVILIGNDPTQHYSGEPGAKILIDNGIRFAAAGSSTGLYFSLQQFYDKIDKATVTSLSEFGNFEVRGNLACYENAHIVAKSPALTSLDDNALSGWSCSVHEAFSAYPQTGLAGFQALAIAKDINGLGSQTFGDGTMGLPYIISRGATPAGCGDGKWNAALGEECDDGNTANGDGCSASCKCENGKPSGSGTCLGSSVGTGTAALSSAIAQTSLLYHNSTAVAQPTALATIASSMATSLTQSTISISSSATPGLVIGVEIIVEVTVVEDCQTKGEVTVTSYITSTCSTLQRPIYSTSNPAYPCYPCQMSSQGITCDATDFITATTTICPSCPAGALPTPILPVIQTCNSCEVVTLEVAPTCEATVTGYIIPESTITATYAPQAFTTEAGFVASYATVGYRPSSTPILFTGGASMKGQSVATGVVLGAAVLAVIALL